MPNILETIAEWAACIIKGKSGEFGYFPQAINAQSTVNLVRVSF